MAEVVGLAGTLSGFTSVSAKANKKLGTTEKITAEFRSSRLGLLTLHESSEPKVDIVFVHGPQGDATRTWATLKVFWPKDLLPRDVPDARILTFGYAALAQGETPLLIKDLGKSLLESLSINRRHNKAASRPLVFMAHSLGGLLVKSALVYSRALYTVDKDAYQISNATCACFFFGTPHVKSGRAHWAQIKFQMSRPLAAYSPALARSSTSMLASAEAEDMHRLSSDFCHQSGRIQLVSCIEMRATSTDLGRLLIVPKESAVMNMPNERVFAIDANHIEMNKFVNKVDPNYRQIVLILRETLSEVRDSGKFAAPEVGKERAAATESIEGRDISHEEDGADLIERDRQFLSSLRSDWLDDVMIEDNSPGTCEWILSSQVFQTWLSGSEKILWIQGNAGAGKTVLAKFLNRELCSVFAGNAVNPGAHRPQWVSCASQPSSRPRQVLAYFLDVNSPQRNSGLSVLQSLLYQILSANQELVRYVRGKTVYSRPERNDFGQYAELLSTILRDPSLGETIIVLDALDECGPASQDKLIDMLSDLVNQSSVQLLVTSRPIERFKPSLTLDLSESEEHVEYDIKKYVETEVRQLTVARELSDSLRDSIRKAILDKSSQGFLWVQLVLQSISKARTARTIRDRLQRLPPNLHDAYINLLERLIGSADVNVRRTLYFVVVGGGPVRVKDLSALLALSRCWDDPYIDTEERFKKHPNWTDVRISPDLEDITENQTMNFERDFREHFQPLLSIKESSVLIAHSSLRGFLEMPREVDKFLTTFNLQPLGDGDLRRVHDIMAILCLQYILAAFRGHNDPLGFSAFACLHWTEHARKAGESRSSHLEILVRQLLSKKDYASSWLSTIANRQATQVTILPSKADVAFIVAAFDLGQYFGNMLGVSAESLQSTDLEGRTPLHLAAANNSLMSAVWIHNVVSEAGQYPSRLPIWKDFKGESPISLAAQNGHEELMERLLHSLKSKYDFDSRLFKIIADLGNIGMFKTLYENTNFKSVDQGMSLLMDAAALNSVDLMKSIVSDHVGLKTDQRPFADVFGDYPLLHVALRKQASQVVDYLLLHRDSPRVIDENGNTTLHVAAQEGNERVVAKLIDVGVSVNSINKDGETPLHIASKIGLPAIVHILCRYGANVNLAGPYGRLPAHLAAETGQDEIINLLLDSGTNINATDRVGRSALHVAAGAGQIPTVFALLMKGAIANVGDEEGRTPMHYAVESGNLSILYTLWEVGADLSATDLTHTTPLHLAAKRVSEALVRELLDLGADPNVQDSDSRTPLHYSCLSEQSTVAVVRTLLDKGADARAPDRWGITPIHLAAERGLDAIVRQLALSGADLKCKDSSGQTPLDYAMKKNQVVVFEVLSELGAAIQAENNPSPLADSRRKVLKSIGFSAFENASGFERGTRLVSNS